MNLGPARNAMLLIICFVAVIGVVFAGAWFYKYSSPSVTTQENATTSEVSELQIPQEIVQLSLVPTENSQEYQLVLSDLTGSLTTVAFQLLSNDVSTPIAATNISVVPTLEQDGWSTVINTQSSSETQQAVSFSLIRTGASNDDEFPSEITLGTIQLNEDVSVSSITLNDKEGFVTYYGAENPARIVLSNATATTTE